MTRPRAKKVVEPLLRELERQGHEVSMAKGGHWKVRREGRFIATIPHSPSDHRSMMNTKSWLRRSGVTIH